MGDRISIGFKNGNEKSVVLFSHWGGIDFLDAAKEYLDELNRKDKDQEKDDVMYKNGPLARREPRTVMVDFVRWLVANGYIDINKRVKGNYYFGTDENDGDNSDNGHFWMDVHYTKVDDMEKKLME